MDAIGDLAWPLMDNYEWAFSLVYVEYTTQERIVKDSARWYKRVMEQSGECP